MNVLPFLVSPRLGAETEISFNICDYGKFVVRQILGVRENSSIIAINRPVGQMR